MENADIKKDNKGRFVKGNQSAKGKKLPEDVKIARKQGLATLVKNILEVMTMTAEDLKNIDMNKIPLSKRSIITAYAKNNTRDIEYYESRAFGKATESVELTGADGSDLITAIRIIPVQPKDNEPRS